MVLSVRKLRMREYSLETSAQSGRLAFTAEDSTDDFSATEVDVYAAVLAAHPEAQLGASHPLSALLVCDKVAIKRDDAQPNLWGVQCDYKTRDAQSEQQDKEPLERDPEIEWSFTQFDEPIDKDIDGFPLLNMNGRPFEGVVRDAARAVLTITRNEDTFSPATAIEYANVTNSDAFIGAEPGQALMKPIRAKRVVEVRDDGEGNPTKKVFWTVTYEIHFKLDEDGWTKVILEADTYVKEDGELKPILDKEGNEVTEPLPLKYIDDDNTEAFTDRAEAIANAWYQEFEVLKSAAFGPLDLESAFTI